MREKILLGLMTVGWNYLPERMRGMTLDEVLKEFGEQ
jgi:hypothetical protein